MTDDTLSPLTNVISIDDERIRNHLDRVVRGSVEETLNALLEAEADRGAVVLEPVFAGEPPRQTGQCLPRLTGGGRVVDGRAQDPLAHLAGYDW